MIYREETRNLFDARQGWWLAHCISADFAMGAGIAQDFTARYTGMRQYLLRCVPAYENTLSFYQNYVETGQMAVIPYSNVFNLITKPYYFTKPTNESMRTAIVALKEKAQTLYVQKIALPRIGCGLDKLDWNDVSQMLREAFEGTDITLLVCNKPNSK